MKKIAFFLFFGTMATVSFAQSIDDIKDQMPTDILKAKTMIDKYQANPKKASNPEGFYYKGLIYNNISSKDSIKATCPDCKSQAFEAFKKYKELTEDKDVLLQLEQYSSLFNIYGSYFDLGAKAFNAADYSTAYTNFKNAEMVEDYIRTKKIETASGFKFPDLDTSLTLNVALAAKLSKDSAGAVVYYKKITDANLSAQSYLGAYQFLVQYYISTNNQPALNEILDKGRKLYPAEEDYWTGVDLYQLEAITNKEAMFKKYDELFQKSPTNYTIGYNYSVDLYNYIFANDDKTINPEKYKEPLHSTLKKVLSIKSTPEANLLMAKFLYNSSFDNGDSARRIKGAKPDEVQKRKALNDMAAAQLDESIPYAQAAEAYYASLPTLKPVEKGNYRSALSILQSVYLAKKNQPKTDEYGKKMKAIQ